MKSMFRTAALALTVALCGGLVASVSAAEGLRILAATNDLAAIARAVTGPDAEIRVVARPDRDLHALEIRPSMMTSAARADVYLSVGLSLDIWSAGIVRGSRNTKLTFLDCSDAITPLEVPTGKVDASMGDVHPSGNPHYWLDPENGKALARFLAGRFAALDAGRGEGYRRNAESFVNEIDARVPGWASALRGKAFVEYHRTWVYAADRFGMRIEGEVEPLPGIPPTAQHLVSLASLIRERKPAVVIRDVFHPAESVEFLERETGVRGVVVSASCAEPTPQSYLATFDHLAEVLGRRPS
jgi:zinc/manganese transport system substrate-binding protein